MVTGSWNLDGRKDLNLNFLESPITNSHYFLPRYDIQSPMCAAPGRLVGLIRQHYGTLSAKLFFLPKLKRLTYGWVVALWARQLFELSSLKDRFLVEIHLGHMKSGPERARDRG